MKEYVITYQQYYLNGKTKGIGIKDTQHAETLFEAKETYTKKLQQRKIRGDIMDYKIIKIIPTEKHLKDPKPLITP